MPAEKAPVNLSRLAGDALQLLRRLFPPEVEILNELEEGVWIRADESQMYQVLMNLALNARDAMPLGGRFRLWLSQEIVETSNTAEDPKPLAALVAEDTGVGMTPEVQARLFEPFFTTKPRDQGTGLGLSIVHGIVTDHGGTIDVESEPGRGTRLTLRLPACRPVPSLQPETAPKPFRRGAGERIVLAQSDPYVRAAVATKLRGCGFEVVETGDGMGLSALVRDASPALVVADAELAGGFALDASGGLPTILTVSDGGEESAENLPKNVCLLRKPFSIQTLADLVAERLEAIPIGG